MTRDYGSVQSRIWRDPDFRRLNAPEQWAYLMLCTQPDISSCGVLTVAPARWARYAADLDTPVILAALDRLQAHEQHYVVLDRDTDELLVRSFIKHDKGYKNAKRLPAIKAAASSVESPLLRAYLNVEMGLVGMDLQLGNALSDSPSDALSGSGNSFSGLPKVLVTVTDTVTDTALGSITTTYSSSSNLSNARELRAVNGGFVSTEAGDE